jgi:hypothetical protein
MLTFFRFVSHRQIGSQTEGQIETHSAKSPELIRRRHVWCRDLNPGDQTGGSFKGMHDSRAIGKP